MKRNKSAINTKFRLFNFLNIVTIIITLTKIQELMNRSKREVILTGY